MNTKQILAVMKAMEKATNEIHENELDRDDFSDKEYAKIVLSFLPKKKKKQKKQKQFVRAGGLQGGERIRYEGEILEVEEVTYDDSDYMWVNFSNGERECMDADDEVELMP